MYNNISRQNYSRKSIKKKKKEKNHENNKIPPCCRRISAIPYCSLETASCSGVVPSAASVSAPRVHNKLISVNR